jgi:hypothetical protein
MFVYNKTDFVMSGVPNFVVNMVLRSAPQETYNSIIKATKTFQQKMLKSKL